MEGEKQNQGSAAWDSFRAGSKRRAEAQVEEEGGSKKQRVAGEASVSLDTGKTNVVSFIFMRRFFEKSTNLFFSV